MNKKIGVSLCAFLGIVSLTGCNNLGNGLNFSKVDADNVNDNTANNNEKEEKADLKVKEIKASNYKDRYSYGEAIDHEGTVIMATFSDDTVKVIDHAYLSFSPAQNTLLTKAGPQLVRVSYSDFEVTCEYSVNVDDGAIASIYAEEYKEEYYQGEYFSRQNLKITALYQSGKKEDITKDCTFNLNSNSRLLEVGNKTVEVNYPLANMSCQFNINVKEALISTIRLKGNCKTNFALGETFNHDGLYIEAVKSNDEVVDVTNNCTFYPSVGSVLSSKGTKTVSIIHDSTGKRLSYKINVNDAELVSISASGYKSTYGKGCQLDHTGTVIKGLYSDGSFKDITSECSFDIVAGTALNVKGTKQINVTHSVSGKTCHYDIEVTDAVLNSIQASCNVSFVEGQSIKKSDINVIGIFSDGSSKNISGWSCDKFGNSDSYTFESAGNVEFNIVYEGKEFALTVTAALKSVSSIEASCGLRFVQGLSINKTDITVIAKYDNDSQVQVYDWTANEFNDNDSYQFTSSGNHTFTISYAGKTKDLVVYVFDPIVTSLKVECNKTFIEGQTLNKSDIKVTASYDNDSEAEVTDWSCNDLVDGSYTFTGVESHTFTVSYGGKTKDIVINACARSLDSISASYTKSFAQGQYINKSDIVVLAHYDNGAEEAVTDWTANEFKDSTSYRLTDFGGHEFTISYCGKSTKLEVSIGDPILTTLSASCSKTIYVDEELKRSDIVVNATYSNGLGILVNSDAWTCSYFGSSPCIFGMAGSATLTISYSGLTCDLPITVVEPAVTDFEASCDKTFTVGETINKSDIVVTATYENNTTKEVTDWTAPMFASGNSYTFEEAGTFEVVITCGDVSKAINVVVEEAGVAVSSLSVNCVRSFKQGEIVNKDDIKVTAVYENNTTATISDWTSSYFGSKSYYQFLSSGNVNLDIKYKGKSTNLPLKIKTMNCDIPVEYVENDSTVTVNKALGKNIFCKSGTTLSWSLEGNYKYSYKDSSTSIVYQESGLWWGDLVTGNDAESQLGITTMDYPTSVKYPGKGYLPTGFNSAKFTKPGTYRLWVSDCDWGVENGNWKLIGTKYTECITVNVTGDSTLTHFTYDNFIASDADSLTYDCRGYANQYKDVVVDIGIETFITIDQNTILRLTYNKNSYEYDQSLLSQSVYQDGELAPGWFCSSDLWLMSGYNGASFSDICLGYPHSDVPCENYFYKQDWINNGIIFDTAGTFTMYCMPCGETGQTYWAVKNNDWYILVPIGNPITIIVV